MLDSLTDYIKGERRRLMLLSLALVGFGGFGLVAGIAGWMACRMI